MSRKNERLVNLTIALLHTSRYLSKAEIFTRVAGYTGSAESMERMFERDKDELRTMGIPISVSQIDPLFDDEIGYRIDPSEYSFDIGPLTPTQVALLAHATEVIEAPLEDLAVKVRSLGDAPSLPEIEGERAGVAPDLTSFLDAIHARAEIAFHYENVDGEDELRSLQPFSIICRYGHWYLTGFDLNRKERRTFRIDRIIGTPKIGNPGSFEIPADFSPQDLFGPLERAVLDVRVGKGHFFRQRALSITEGEESDRIVIAYDDESFLLERILWHLDDVLVVEPLELRRKVIQSLQEVVRIHE